MKDRELAPGNLSFSVVGRRGVMVKKCSSSGGLEEIFRQKY